MVLVVVAVHKGLAVVDKSLSDTHQANNFAVDVVVVVVNVDVVALLVIGHIIAKLRPQLS